MITALPLHICGVVLEEPDLAAVSKSDVAAWMDYDTVMIAEAPEVPLEVQRYRVRNMPHGLGVRLFIARDRSGMIVGDGRAVVSRAPEHEHLCQAHVSVRPGWRGRGLGHALLRLVVEAAGATERTMLIGWSCAQAASGERFARRLGAQPAITHFVNRLLIDELDRTQLQSWLDRGGRCGTEYELRRFDGVYSDDLLETIAALRRNIEMAVPGGIEMEPAAITAADVREADRRGIGGSRWTLAVRHRASGDLVGVTEVFFPSNQPSILKQLSTAVRPDHRGRGLGKWMKAAMLRQVIEGRPEVREIRTANFASNVPILGINRALGFKPFIVSTGWRVPVASVREYLARIPVAS
jgi:mycothiol synthase